MALSPFSAPHVPRLAKQLRLVAPSLCAFSLFLMQRAQVRPGRGPCAAGGWPGARRQLPWCWLPAPTCLRMLHAPPSPSRLPLPVQVAAVEERTLVQRAADRQRMSASLDALLAAQGTRLLCERGSPCLLGWSPSGLVVACWLGLPAPC